MVKRTHLRTIQLAFGPSFSCHALKHCAKWPNIVKRAKSEDEEHVFLFLISQFTCYCWGNQNLHVCILLTFKVSIRKWSLRNFGLVTVWKFSNEYREKTGLSSYPYFVLFVHRRNFPEANHLIVRPTRLSNLNKTFLDYFLFVKSVCILTLMMSYFMEKQADSKCISPLLVSVCN